MARWRSGNAGVCKTSMRGFDPRPRLIFMEREGRKNKSKDVTGFSEKQLDVNVEIGVFKRTGVIKKKKIKKVLFEKKVRK